MNLYEIEGKRLFDRFKMPVPKGALLKNASEFEGFIYPCVVKSQVLSGKRGKAGGIKFAHGFNELKEAVKEISRMTIYRKKVDAILIEEKLNILEEHYLGITIDTIEKEAVLMYSPCGGIDIEALAREEPEKLLKIYIYEEIHMDIIKNGLEKFNFNQGILYQLLDIIQKLIKLFYQVDATTVEINPLVVNDKKELVAADSKLIIDDNALYRQENYQLIERIEEVEEVYRRASAAGLSYVEVDEEGDIGLIAGGAGIGMATMDTIRFYGGKPFNFLDLGGGASQEKTREAMKILLENEQLKGIIVNVFGGINNCEIMAKGIKEAIEEIKTDKTIVVKSRGHSQEEGWRIFEDLGLHQVKHGTTDDAVMLLLREMEVR